MPIHRLTGWLSLIALLGWHKDELITITLWLEFVYVWTFHDFKRFESFSLGDETLIQYRDEEMGKLEALGNNETGHLGFLLQEGISQEKKYSQLETRFDLEEGISWVFMKPKGVPCFDLNFISEMQHYHQSIKDGGGKIVAQNGLHSIRYQVVASQVPGVFNLGGHLALFSELIRNSDRQGLMHYAKMCIDTLVPRIQHFNLPLVTISLIQGDAMGGGFEAALSSDIIIAERSSKMGFPEILFNLFPGMGAYSFLARKVGTVQAEKIILSGKLYSAVELHALGLVDVLVEDGGGEEAVYDYVAKQTRHTNGFIAVQKARLRFNPVTYQELLDITSIWVDAALKLNDKDLKVMDRFIRSQQKHYVASAKMQHSVEAVQQMSVTAVVQRKTEMTLAL